MDLLAGYASAIAEHWTIWLVTVVLVLAAVIDGFELKVPNWVTFPFIISGWIYSTAAFGFEGLGWSLLGTVIGRHVVRRESEGRERRSNLAGACVVVLARWIDGRNPNQGGRERDGFVGQRVHRGDHAIGG